MLAIGQIILQCQIMQVVLLWFARALRSSIQCHEVQVSSGCKMRRTFHFQLKEGTTRVIV